MRKFDSLRLVSGTNQYSATSCHQKTYLEASLKPKAPNTEATNGLESKSFNSIGGAET